MTGQDHPAGPAGVRIRDWSWRHAGRPGPAVGPLSLDIPAGQRVLLLGASGAGKSTLLQALAGVLGPDTGGVETGSLLVDGKHPTAARGRAGLVLQDPDSQIVLSRVGDEVAFGAENLRVPAADIWRRVCAALESVGLRVPLDSSTAALSGGQKQRLALASVLAMQPGLLLLDEPTANLDPAGVEEVRDAVVQVADATGATLVVVEHRVQVWADVVDRIIVLGAGGGVLADGSPASVLGQETPHGQLRGAGVWIPGGPPVLPAWRPPAPGQELLRTRGLAVSRTPRGRPVLTDVDLALEAGTALGIIGPNGAGKSTLALTLGGLLRPSAGTLTAARPLAGGARPEPWRWSSRQLVHRIGSVFQEPEHQFLAGTVLDELAFGPRRAGRESEKDIAARAAALAGRLHLDHLLAANPFTLSGGEKRRLSVGTMLATSPQVLLLDEPTFGQDARTWAEMVVLLRAVLDDGASVVAVTHDAEFVAALDARLLQVEGGRAAGVVLR